MGRCVGCRPVCRLGASILVLPELEVLEALKRQTGMHLTCSLDAFLKKITLKKKTLTPE